jgi:HEAT repeat protein
VVKLEDPAELSRLGAVKMLARVSVFHLTPPVVKRLIDMLENDPASAVRVLVATCLGRVVTEHRDVLPALLHRLENGVMDSVKVSVIRSLHGIDTQEVLRAVVGQLGSPSESIRTAAIAFLRRTRSHTMVDSPWIIDVILGLIGLCHGGTAREHLIALGVVRASPALTSEKVIPKLVEHMVEPNPWTSEVATESLRMVYGRHPHLVWAVARDRLRDSDSKKRHEGVYVVAALSSFPPEAVAVRETLVAALGDTEKRVRVCAVRSLGTMLPSDPTIGPVLVDMLEASHHHMRMEAVNALQIHMSAAVTSLVVTMIKKTPHNYGRMAALNVLSAIPSTHMDDGMVEVLVGCLEGTWPEIRRQAISILGRMPPELIGAAILERIVAALGDRDVGEAAISALVSLVVDPDRLIPPLMHEHHSVREAALTVLTRTASSEDMSAELKAAVAHTLNHGSRRARGVVQGLFEAQAKRQKTE